MAAVSSPNTAPMGTRNNAPMPKAIMAAMGPPPVTIQSPTCSTQPVPMMAPKPMVKKFHSDRVFFMPPCSGAAVWGEFAMKISSLLQGVRIRLPLGQRQISALFFRLSHPPEKTFLAGTATL